jgi:hypothetical protein
MLKARTTAIVSMIFMAAASRLVPHPPNMTAVTAMALFGGAYLSDWRQAFAVTLGALFLSDALLGFYGHMEFVHGSFVAIAAIGLMLRRRRSVPNIAVAALASSVLLFLLTNLGVWATSGLYPFTMAGLVACYTAALPFFRNMLAGDFLCTLALFGGFATMEYLMPALRQGRGVPASLA